MTIVYKANRIEGLSSDTKPADQYNGRIFYETDTSKSFSFDGSIWNEIGGGSSLTDSSVQASLSETIGDYYNPSSVSVSSQGYDTLISDTESTVSGGTGNLETPSDLSPSNDGDWDTKTTYYGVLGSSVSHIWDFQSVRNNITEVRVKHTIYKNNTTNSVSTNSIYVSQDNVSYTLIHTVQVSGTGSYTSLNDNTITISAQGVRYVKITIQANSSTQNYSYLYGCSLGIPASSSRLTDDDTSTVFQTQVENNPYISLDSGSSQTITGLAIYHDSNTTETTYKIQTSPDNSTWTDKRTIAVSNLTSDSWNFIRIPIVTARYIRVYGNNTSKKIAMCLIKYLKTTDTMPSDHVHLSIDSNDSSLLLNGASS